MLSRPRPSVVLPTLVVAMFLGCAAGPAKPVKVAPSPTAQKPPGAGLDYDQLLQAAQSYLDAGRPDGAADAARQATEQAPKRPDAWMVWGRALAQANRLTESAEKYQQALALGHRDKQLYVELASIYDVAKRYPEAIATYEGFLAGHPKDVEMHQQLALTLVLAGRHDDAIRELQLCVDLAPKIPQLREDLAYALLQGGRLEDAEQTIVGVLQKESKRPQALATLARIRAAQGRLPDAIRLLDQAVAVARTDPEPVRLRAKLKVLAGDHAGALVDYEMLARADPKDASALVGASGALIALGRLDDATERVARAAMLIGEHPILGFRRAQIAWRRGEKGAVAVVEQFARDRPDSLEAWREVHDAAKKHGDAGLVREAQKRLDALSN